MSYVKKTVRKNLLQKRDGLSSQTRKNIALSALEHSVDLWASAGQILCYAPYGSELPLLESLFHLLATKKNQKISVFLPRVEKDHKMSFWSFRQGDRTVVNKWGIAEPEPAKATQWTPNLSTVALVPALAVDRAGNRLGYGGGFYDRFFGANPQVLKFALLPDDSFLDVATWPVDETDIFMEWVATEKQLVRCSGAS